MKRESLRTDTWVLSPMEYAFAGRAVLLEGMRGDKVNEAANHVNGFAAFLIATTHLLLIISPILPI